MTVDCCAGEKYADFSTNYGVKEYRFLAMHKLKFDTCRPGVLCYLFVIRCDLMLPC